MRRILIALAGASAFMLMTVSPVQADSTSVDVPLGSHARCSDWVWYDNDTWTDTDGNGWDDTITYTVHFRVQNIDTRRIQGSAIVRSVIDAIGGPDVTRHTQTFTFALAPGQTAPDQSFIVGPVTVYEDSDVWSDEWVALATWHSVRIRG